MHQTDPIPFLPQDRPIRRQLAAAADRLQELHSFPLIERDRKWSIPLFQEYDRTSYLHDFIAWAWHDAPGQATADEREQAAPVLAWFLTTSHRAFRDKSTKALIALLVDHLPTATRLLRAFSDVNDDYVLERVCAAAFGAVLRSSDLNGMEDLVAATCEAAFEPDPHPHLGVRFYAGRLVEEASANIPGVSVRLSAPRPPFPPRPWPDDLLPSTAYEHRFTDRDGRVDPIWHSITGFTGDFGLYVMGANHWRFPFGQHPHGRLSLDEVKAAVFDRILALGWTAGDPIARFDREHRSRDRHAGKPERLGKKYQWIAWRQVQALAMDALVPVQDESLGRWGSYSDEDWLRDALDIDPTLLLEQQDEGDWPAWWSPAEGALAPALEDASWISPDGPLPDVRGLAEVIDPEGVPWYALQFSRQWGSQAQGDPEETRHVWMAGRCYLVRRSVSTEAEEWANSRQGWGWSIWSDRLEPSDLWSNHVLFREYWSSPTFHQRSSESGFDGEGPPVAIRSTGRRYFCEANGFDQSVDTSIALWLPHEDLVEELGLHHGPIDGDYVDVDGRVVVRDPTGRESGPEGLLLRADAAGELLDVGYNLLWLVLGEKMAPERSGNAPGYATFRGTLRVIGPASRPQWSDRVTPPTSAAVIIRAAAAPSPRDKPVGERAPLLTAQGLGVPGTALAAAEKQGVLERVVPGVYMGSTEERSDLTEAAGWTQRHPGVVIGLLTAAAHHGLVDAYPGATWMFVPKGGSPPRSRTSPVTAIQTAKFIEPERDGQHGIQRLRRHGVTLRITSPDRTALDLWRYPRKISREHAKAALQRRVRADDFDLPRFRRLAELLGAWKKIELLVEGLVSP